MCSGNDFFRGFYDFIGGRIVVVAGSTGSHSFVYVVSMELVFMTADMCDRIITVAMRARIYGVR